MGDLNDQIQSDYQEVEKNAKALSDVLGTAGYRAPPHMPSADGVFQNGRDLTLPPGASPTVNAPPATAGKATVVIDDKVELLHFGTTYLDGASAFGHDKLDDTDPKLDLASQAGGHAIQYRAALEREAILLSGFFSAHMAALGERDTDEGTLGKVMGVVGNLLGGGGGMSSQAEPADLNPYVEKAKAIGKAIDVDSITYDVTHKAGIDLHDLRASYRKYLDGELDKSKTPPADAGLLASIPALSNLLPPEIGHIFTLVEKMSTKAFDIYVSLVLDLTRTMMPVIETACRDITVDAITKKKTPIFSVWLPPPDKPDTPAHLIDAPSAPAPTGIAAIDNLVSRAVGKVAGVVGTIDQKADPVVDFLSRPGKTAPGGPFLDQVFEELDDGAGYLKTAAGVDGIGPLVAAAVGRAFGFDLPDFVKGLIAKVCGVHADFLRGVFGVLCSLDPSKPISEAALVEAGRTQIVSQLIEAVAHSIGLLDKIRSFSFNLNLFGPIEKTLSGEALFQRGKELIEQELGPHLDPLVELLMKHFAAVLESARTEAGGAMTMEVYLSRLPTLYALLFRKTFFPMWDLFVETVFKPVSDLLDPMTGKVEALANKAKGIVDTVRTGLLRASKVVNTALSQGVSLGLAQSNLGQYQQDLAAVLGDGSSPTSPTAASTTFPLPGRKTTGSGKAADDATRKKVEPDDKWKAAPDPTAPAAGTAASSSQPAASTSTSAAAPA